MISKAQENEIIRLRKEGATYREIKFVQGLNTYNPILRVLQQQGMTRAIGKRHKGIRNLDLVKNKYIREAIESRYWSKRDFARYLGMSVEKASMFLDGDAETRLTIGQVAKICKLTGKTFEEVFGYVE